MNLNKFGKIITAFISSLFIYIFIVGRFTPAEIIAGIILSLIIAVLVVNFFPLDLKYLNPIRIFWLFIYLFPFLWYMIKANLIIASTVIKPSLPISPGILRGKTELKSPLGKLLLTSSITLTPGTLSVDIEGDEVQIHCVQVKEGYTAENIMKPFEKFIKRITE